MTSLLLSLRATWIAAVLGTASAPALAQAPALEAASIGRTEGHAQLVWEATGEGDFEFELEYGATEAFAEPESVYRGGDRASFRSGLPAGTHWFRLRQRALSDAEWSPWSSAVPVEIEPYELAQAWSLFAAGAGLVAAVVGYLVTAGRRSNGTEGAA